MDTVFLALRVVVSLAVVIGAIWFVQKRLGRAAKVKSKSKPIAMIARQTVGVKASVAVVEFGAKRFLLGVTEHGISVLDSTEIAAAETSPVTSGRHFADALSQVESGAPSPAAATRELLPDSGVENAFRRRREPAKTPLAGSILSASTWRQAFAALRTER
ncbi:MAG: flagellar protein FliO/FliZ [Actinomycetota bacterium]|nr:flagellar protein FliO/FliZ [Actinomycetota bacterium]MDQ1573036.1 flagellar protein FliO/FliZ [Actinomycetota bacterium]